MAADHHATQPDRHVVLYHSPRSRSAGVRMLLEELGADYELHLLDLQAGEQRAPAYLAVNPMGKVPALRHGAALVTEQVAVYLYLADLYPEAGLAPPIGDALRGPYLRWMAFYGSSFEPAMIDRAMKREPPAVSMSPYGDVETVLGVVFDQLSRGPYIVGERYTAADVLWAAALGWMTAFKLVEATPTVRAYVDRVTARPGVARAREKDAALLAAAKSASQGQGEERKEGAAEAQQD
jgi:glutathione S-transferase